MDDQGATARAQLQEALQLQIQCMQAQFGDELRRAVDTIRQEQAQEWNRPDSPSRRAAQAADQAAQAAAAFAGQAAAHAAAQAAATPVGRQTPRLDVKAFGHPGAFIGEASAWKDWRIVVEAYAGAMYPGGAAYMESARLA